MTTLAPLGVAAGLTAEELQLATCIATAWMLLCTFLVVSMQLGFAMLEVGSVREAHRMTVLAKNVLDSVVSCMVFWAVCTQWYTPSIVTDEHGVQQPHKLMFQWAFCATCVTICSGSMAERTHMVAYLCYAVVMAGVIYPRIADAAWGKGGFFLYDQFHGRFNEKYVFHDFAGSGVVHLTGGVAAFIGNAMLGRRIIKPQPNEDGGLLQQPISVGLLGTPPDGASPPRAVEDLQDLEDQELEEVLSCRPLGGWQRRYGDERWDAHEFRVCNYLQVMGMFTLWVGWYGFNTGLTVGTKYTHVGAAGIVAWNTTLAACAGGFGAYLNCYLFHAHIDTAFLANGVLSGLVSITASCDVASDTIAAFIGLTAGLFVYPVCSRSLRWLLLDDPVDAIAVHAGCGLFGVLVCGLCRPNCNFMLALGGTMASQLKFCSEDHSTTEQFIAQAWGAFTILWWAGSNTLVLWSVFALSELTRSMEVTHLAEADQLLCKMTTPQPTSELVGAADQWKSVYHWSPAARRIMKRHGWQPGVGFSGGAPDDLWRLRVELQRARAERETALEIEEHCKICPLWSIARCAHNFRFAREIALLRLRISPASELSGLGAADADGGQFFQAIRKVVLLLQEVQNAQRSVHSPLKREVQDLTMMIQNQDAALQRLARGGRRGFWRHHRQTLSSVPEQPEAGAPQNGQVPPSGGASAHHRDSDAASVPSSSASPSPRRDSPSKLLVQGGHSAARGSMDPDRSWQGITERDSEQALAPISPYSRMLPTGTPPRMLPTGTSGSSTSRTVSDRSAGLLTPRSAGEDTPPPTIIGRMQGATRMPATGQVGVQNVNEVVGQLATMVQAQQELLELLQQGSASLTPTAGHGQGHGQHAPAAAGLVGLSLPARQHLFSALESVARQRENVSGPGSSVSTQ